VATEKDLYKLTSLDEFGSRISIIPAEVRGKFRFWRTRVHLILLFIFLALPWIHIDGHQVLLLNIPNREFNFFGLLFRAHDAPLLFFIVAIVVVGLAFVTAIWGRIWCGWACPQTVFIDAVFRRIEFVVEGNYLARRKLLNEPSGIKKIAKRTLKWILFILVSSLISHSFIAYFAGSEELLQMMKRDPSENWNYFLFVSFVTTVVLFDFAWFREQFCVIMCPYGRLQGVLLESNSYSVVYNQQRGEPRKGIQPATEKRGDCVGCNKCVEVCPTGIDIRNGLQMECISCMACVDACDEIMAKVKKPAGLIGYKTLNGAPMRFLKLKTIFYGFIILFSVGSLAYTLVTREPLNIALLRAADTPYTISLDQQGKRIVLNHFRLHLTNQTNETSQYRIDLSPENVTEGFALILAQNPIELKAKSSDEVHLFVRVEAEKISDSGRAPFKVFLTDLNGERYERELTMVGPSK